MTDLAITTNNRITSLAPYGERSEVKELAERIKMMLPGGAHYNDTESLTLAQIGIAHDLDPFNGEVWLIKDNESGKVYGALIGIKGLRKHAKKQANYWGVGNNGGFFRVTDPRQLEAYGAPSGALVYEYKFMDEITLEGWTRQAGKLRKIGCTLEDITRLLGPAPFTLGVGIYSPGEKTKMKPHQVAMYRAEKDALKRRFDVRFKIEIDGVTLPVTANTEIEEEDTNGEEYDDYADEPQDQNEILEELGYKPEQPKTEKPGNNGGHPTTWPTAYVNALIENRLASNTFDADGMLKKSNLPKDAPLDTVITWARNYRGWRDLGGTPEQAAKAANAGELPK